jgi:hypothetical protein
MKEMDGCTLEEPIAAHPIAQTPANLVRLVAMLKEVRGAVAYAQARGVIHRDLKPPNISPKAFLGARPRPAHRIGGRGARSPGPGGSLWLPRGAYHPAPLAMTTAATAAAIAIPSPIQ